MTLKKIFLGWNCLSEVSVGPSLAETTLFGYISSLKSNKISNKNTYSDPVLTVTLNPVRHVTKPDHFLYVTFPYSDKGLIIL